MSADADAQANAGRKWRETGAHGGHRLPAERMSSTSGVADAPLWQRFSGHECLHRPAAQRASRPRRYFNGNSLLGGN
jgi:hypothetical protein